MSVPVNLRSHGKLEALTKAYELCTYTLKITKNKKIFTEDFQEEVTDKINECALDIFLLCGSANDEPVRSAADLNHFQNRLALQAMALKRCGDLKRLIVIAKPLFHLASKRVTYWTGLTAETRNLIKGWTDSDKERFGKLFKG